MTLDQAREIAYVVMVATLPASWLKKLSLKSNQVTPRARRLQIMIADEIVAAYNSGVRDGVKQQGK